MMYCRSFGSKLPIWATWSQFTFAVYYTYYNISPRAQNWNSSSVDAAPVVQTVIGTNTDWELMN